VAVGSFLNFLYVVAKDGGNLILSTIAIFN